MLRSSFTPSLRKLPLIVAVLALVLVMGGVQAQDGIGGTLTNLGFGLGDEIARERVAHFQELYPEVDLQMTEGALDEQQFLTAVASGNPPDMVYMGREVLSTYAIRGALMPLTDCIASQEIDMTQYRQAAVEQVTVGGVVYGIPEFFNNVMLMINTVALDEAGLTLEDIDPSDWDNINMLNDALTVGSGNSLNRIGYDPKLPEFLPLWAEANGVSLISDDGRTAQLNDPKVVEALEFAYSLYATPGGYPPFKAFRDTWDFFGGNNQIVANQVGMWPMEQWYMNVLAGVAPEGPIAFMPFEDREGNPISYSTGSAWAIPTGSKNPEAACAFMKAVTSPEAWIRAATARAELRAEAGAINTGVYTGNVLADEVIFSEIVTPSGNEIFDNGVQVILSLQENAFAIAPNPAGAQFRQAWVDAVNRVINGEQSVQEALDQAQAEAQAALDEAWARQQ
ncbi:MAG TPA: extracellular solute-binding protein [Aggregatilineales bacterium]|nr:extracellular solute-binding protein [Aggregatilineales bacterium]